MVIFGSRNIIYNCDIFLKEKMYISFYKNFLNVIRYDVKVISIYDDEKK